MEEHLNKEYVLNELYKAYNYGNLGLFIGAGFSKAVVDNGLDNLALSWGELIDEVCERLNVNVPNSEDIKGMSYPEVATRICEKISEQEGISYLEAKNIFKKGICDFTNWLPSEEKRETFSQYLNKINPSWIITTNYDLVIERLLTGRSKTLSPKDNLTHPKSIIPIYHLHGVRHEPESIVITQDDYIPLFRPNEYRQTKLSLTIKESTTLILGYQLGDVNVQSAVDWSKNIFPQSKEYPHEIIQAIRKSEPSSEPYRNISGNIVIEINEIEDFLQELTDFFIERENEYNTKIEKINELIGKLTENKAEQVDRFIKSQELRLGLLKLLSRFEQYMVTPYIDFMSACIDKTWENAAPDGAFDAYDDNLRILLDIVINYEYKKMPPALFEFVCYSLDRVLEYVGDYISPIPYGKSFKATSTWHNKKKEIPLEMLEQFYHFSKYKYSRLFRKVKVLVPHGTIK
ncbi:SIR2 family NAD-dependent protein deacylase [Bacillus sp. JJ1562]|uniref:SIR2 family NAD-dependent protein deacylase n=1 Tax=Bacillus sp. JJ1562 TaxID=3122960 RepID=UPI003002EFF6